MASDEGNIVFDPFGGSGTTYIAAELKGRKWVGCEIGPVDDIINRFDKIDEEGEFLAKTRDNLNALFPDKVRKKREVAGLWTCEAIRENVDNPQPTLDLVLEKAQEG
jgi:site-specific DNA-methyltransferase (adenine-specific)